MANPVLISATKNNAAIAAANTSATVSSTGNVTAGNIMVVAVLVSGAIAPTGITAPDGTWTTFLATTTTEASGLVSAAIFYKRSTATGAFSGSFSWTTASTGGEWSFTEWAGAGGGIVDGTVGTTLNASSTNPTSPSKTPTAGVVNDTLVCMIFGGVLSTSTVAIPGGMSSILTVNGSATQPLFGAASLALASASATGTETWTLGTGQAVLGVSFLLQAGPDLNLHFIGHHKAAQHTVQSGLRFSSIDSSQSGPVSVVSVTNNAFVMTYYVPAAPIATRYNLYFKPDFSTSGPQPETQPHFIARPWPVKFNILPALRANSATDAALGVEPGANPHFTPRYWNPENTVLTDLWQGQAGDSPNPQDALTHFVPRFTAVKFNWRPYFTSASEVIVVPVVETNTHFVARFQPPKHFLLPAYRWNFAADQSAAQVQPDTQPHFLGRFHAPQHFLLAGLRQNVPLDPTFPVQPETNVHFVGRFSQPHHVLVQALRQNVAADQSTATVQPSTEPHFVGKFTAPTFKRFAFNLTPEDINGFVQPETNTHFVAKLRPDQFRILPLLRSNVAADNSTVTAQPSTEPHFLAKPWPVKLTVNPALRQVPALDAQADTNVHFVPRHVAPVHKVLRALFTEPTVGQPIIIPETNTHFVPRFSAPRHFLLPLLRDGTDHASSGPLPLQPETNPHWIGRFTEPQHYVARSLFSNLGNDTLLFPNRALASDFASWVCLAQDV